MHIKGVVFDLDHTLYDRYATLTAIAPYFCSYFDVSPGMTPQTLAPIWIEADKQCVHLGWPAVIAYLAERGVFRTVPEISTYSAFLLGWFRRVSVPFPETKQLLADMRAGGVKTGLITNGSGETQRAKLANLGLEDSFDQIVITGEFGVHKPAPEPFLAIARWLGAEPSELLYVGDNPLNDVEASRGAGFVPVWVRTTGTWVYPEIEKPALQIDHIRELPALLERLG
ncbi:MAG: HAD family hydrolase [Clostridia bacterium]|nr:HAD family hydrolase [Clostridia bacterium]